jgi:hypothetical protein
MSWLFSQALVEAYSADICSDGEQSAPLNGNHIQQAYCASDKMKDFSRLSRFGMTYKPLTDDLGAGVLTWCLAASLVRTFPQQEKAPESMEHEAECGDTWRESFARWDLATSLWKTLQCSLLEGLDVFSETWPKWGMMRAGECSVQSMPALRTSGIEFGSLPLWPTPRTTGLDGGSNSRKAAKSRGMWPTPTVDDSANVNPKPNRFFGLVAAVNETRFYPTPSANEDSYRLNGNSQQSNCLGAIARREALKESPESGGQLNPTWVEWLMGWPLGWTDLKPLGTDKFQAWQRSHGGY